MRQCLEKEELLQGDFTFIFTQAASTYSLNIGHHDETNTCLLALSKGVKKGKEDSFFLPKRWKRMVPVLYVGLSCIRSWPDVGARTK
jgi:hypothetical protein